MNRDIRVKVGETFEIPLEGNAGTGFRWEIALPPEMTKLIELVEETREAATTVPGGRTHQRFRCRALAPGILSLAFRYRRSWESPTSGNEQTFNIQIDPAA